jgi:hypothetical protein
MSERHMSKEEYDKIGQALGDGKSADQVIVVLGRVKSDDGTFKDGMQLSVSPAFAEANREFFQGLWDLVPNNKTGPVSFIHIPAIGGEQMQAIVLMAVWTVLGITKLFPPPEEKWSEALYDSKINGIQIPAVYDASSEEARMGIDIMRAMVEGTGVPDSVREYAEKHKESVV